MHSPASIPASKIEALRTWVDADLGALLLVKRKGQLTPVLRTRYDGENEGSAALAIIEGIEAGRLILPDADAGPALNVTSLSTLSVIPDVTSPNIGGEPPRFSFLQGKVYYDTVTGQLFFSVREAGSMGWLPIDGKLAPLVMTQVEHGFDGFIHVGSLILKDALTP